MAVFGRIVSKAVVPFPAHFGRSMMQPGDGSLWRFLDVVRRFSRVGPNAPAPDAATP
jgi:hypothetical protein